MPRGYITTLQIQVREGRGISDRNTGDARYSRAFVSAEGVSELSYIFRPGSFATPKKSLFTNTNSVFVDAEGDQARPFVSLIPSLTRRRRLWYRGRFWSTSQGRKLSKTTQILVPRDGKSLHCLSI